MKQPKAIVSVPIVDLIPYARNARTHSDAQVAQIAASMREWGWTNPVLIAPDKTIIAGHGRVMAARKLGVESVPCIVADGWTDAQVRAYVIADNKLALNAGWDDELVRVELIELQDVGFDLSFIGFDPESIDSMIGGEVEPLSVAPTLPDGEKYPFQTMTFTLHDEQAEQVISALKIAKSIGYFVDTKNENSNGNALARICEDYLASHD